MLWPVIVNTFKLRAIVCCSGLSFHRWSLILLTKLCLMCFCPHGSAQAKLMDTAAASAAHFTVLYWSSSYVCKALSTGRLPPPSQVCKALTRNSLQARGQLADCSAQIVHIGGLHVHCNYRGVWRMRFGPCLQALYAKSAFLGCRRIRAFAT